MGRTFDEYFMRFGLWYWNADEFEIAYLVVANCFHVRGNGVSHLVIHGRSLPVGTRGRPNCESLCVVDTGKRGGWCR